MPSAIRKDFFGPILIEGEIIKLGIFVISHKDSKQLERVDELLAAISSDLTKCNVELISKFKILWQPNNRIKVPRSYFKFQAFKFRSYKSWFALNPFHAAIRTLASEVRLSFRGKSQFQISRDLLYVATVVTQKNVRAWERLLDENLDAALIIEDDALIDGSALPTFSDAVLNINSTHPTFINLAKANNLDRYVFSKQKDTRGKTHWNDAKIADTACAYLINNSCAEIILNEYRSIKNYDAIAIDFVLSDIFIKNKSISVLHSESHYFTNGSLFGNFESQTGASVRKDF